MEKFLEDLKAGLTKVPKSIAPKYFYDAAGSDLFDKICELTEYYPTRTEMLILSENASKIAEAIGPNAELVEFGAGSLKKVRPILRALEARHAAARFVPIDISEQHLKISSERLREEFPSLEVQPIVGDYTTLNALPVFAGDAVRAGFFPGSTIGNMDPDQAVDFLKNAKKLLEGGGLLVGVDLVKAPELLHAAYNDSEGVTAEFNLNLLRRANADLQADFDIDSFQHFAAYNADLRRIEMHLVSTREQKVTLDGEVFLFQEGESIHTESSHKYTIESFQNLAMEAGFSPKSVWVDEKHMFSVHWLAS